MQGDVNEIFETSIFMPYAIPGLVVVVHYFDIQKEEPKVNFQIQFLEENNGIEVVD